jgi:hypothetical protein
LPCITNFLKPDTFQPPPGRTDDECENADLVGQPNPISFHGARWALWHNPENLTDRQQDTLEGLARTTNANYRASIEAALRYRLSNALVASTNQKIRLISRRGYGYHSAEAIIALAKLSLGGLCPPLPGRS